ncbi:MAG: hypothetical protein IPM53_01940 [Anaerolineaceae bacterium]|nr:hypothetical protein [Anaerolineaceae bacterium]
MFDTNKPFWEISEKIFLPYLETSICARPFQLYGDFSKAIFSNPAFELSNIYFIAENTKVRFIPEKTTVHRNGKIKFALQVANKYSITHKMDLARLLLGDEMPQRFKSTIAGVKNLDHFRKKLNKWYSSTTTGISINKGKSTENYVVLDLYTSNMDAELPPIFPHDLIDLQKIKIEGFPKILYIGKSLQIKNRTSNHAKIQRALSEVADNKDIFVNFIKFSAKKLIMNSPNDFIQTLKEPEADYIEKEGLINLVEMSLINYFKPIYNSNFVESDIPSNKQVENLLVANGFSQMVCEINFEAESCFFGSDHISPSFKHILMYQLSNKS